MYCLVEVCEIGKVMRSILQAFQIIVDIQISMDTIPKLKKW